MAQQERPFDEFMRRALSHVGFSADRPDPAAAWEAFKSFVVQPVPGQRTITVGFTCTHDGGRDATLWLEFARQFEDELTGLGQRCGCAFSRAVPDALVDVQQGSWWWPEHGTLEQWFVDVEAMPAFARCVRLPDWRFEGYAA